MRTYDCRVIKEHERTKHLEVVVRSTQEAADVALQQYEAGLKVKRIP
jgi:hypothetical protein